MSRTFLLSPLGSKCVEMKGKRESNTILRESKPVIEEEEDEEEEREEEMKKK